MLNKNNFFNNFYFNSKRFKSNLKKTKKTFNSLKLDIKNLEIPMLESYDQNYKFDFSASIVNKFSKYKNIVIIGMGGSILGSKSIYSFLKRKIKKQVFFFDNLDSNLHSEFKKVKNFRNSCFIIISKSGNTLETITNLCSLFSKNLFSNKLVIISEINNSNLMDIAIKYNAEIIEHKEFIGGRYSVLSEVGMFPAALMGLNVNKFKNLKKLMNNKNFTDSLIFNVASIYTLYQQGINNSVIINYHSMLNDLGYWYQQLSGESLGKDGKGITPIVSSGPKDHHSLLQLYLDGPRDKFFTFLNVKEKGKKNKIPNNIKIKNMEFLKNKSLEFIINAQSQAAQNIFKKKKIPYRQIIFSEINEEKLGKIFTFFVLETILLASLMNINPFDQPAVEQVKIETKRFF